MNPLGTVPALFDGDVRLTESSAICQYLAQRHSPRALNVEPDEADFGAYLNLLIFGEATLTFPLSLVLRYSRMEPPDRRQPQVVDDYCKWFLARLRALEPQLAQQAFLCAGRFTAADVAVGYALLVAQQLRLAERFTPSVSAAIGNACKPRRPISARCTRSDAAWRRACRQCRRPRPDQRSEANGRQVGVTLAMSSDVAECDSV